MASEKHLEYYLSLPYKIEITPEEDGAGFAASIPKLKGSVAFGETVEEAVAAINEVKRNWIEIALEQCWKIPEPDLETQREYSGKFSVRLPRYLHRKLAELAKEEGTSLNQLVMSFLSEGAERCRYASQPEHHQIVWSFEPTERIGSYGRFQSYVKKKPSPATKRQWPTMLDGSSPVRMMVPQ